MRGIVRKAEESVEKRSKCIEQKMFESEGNAVY